MSEPTSAMRPHASMLWRLYAIFWVVLAGFAISYIAMSATQPGFYGSITGITALEAKQTALAEKAKVAQELKSLRSTVKNLNMEIERAQLKMREGNLRYAAKQSDAAPSRLFGDAEAVSTATRTITSQLQAPTDNLAGVPADLRNTDNELARHNVSIKHRKSKDNEQFRIPPLPDRGPSPKQFLALAASSDASEGGAILINDERTVDIITGTADKLSAPSSSNISINEDADKDGKEEKLKDNVEMRVSAESKKQSQIVFGAPTVTTELQFDRERQMPPAAVVISTASSLSRLRLDWQRLSAQYPILIGKLEPRYDHMGTPNSRYRLLTGPLPGRIEANQLCAALTVQDLNLKCSIGEFVGNSL